MERNTVDQTFSANISQAQTKTKAKIDKELLHITWEMNQGKQKTRYQKKNQSLFTIVLLRKEIACQHPSKDKFFRQRSKNNDRKE